MTYDEMIDIILALKNKEPVERQLKGYSDWTETGLGPDFNTYNYRRKPREPKEWWNNVYSGRTIVHRFPTKEEADKNADPDRLECVHVREVLGPGEA